MIPTKLIWAVNAFEPCEDPCHALYLLGALSRGTLATVKPVFVFSPPAHPLKNGIALEADARLLEYSKDSGVAQMEAGQVISCPKSSMREQVRALLQFTESYGGEAIVVSTHARKGVQRAFLGSFAETLLLHAQIPVFTVNPQTQVRERISKILFPTNFEERYAASYERTLDLAAAVGATVDLFYKEPLIPSPFMTPEIYEYIELEANARKEDARAWMQHAAAAGVPAAAHLDPNPGHVAPAICKFADDAKVDLIVMPSEGQGMMAALLGSYARQVVREALCPVCVMRVRE